MSLLGKLFNSNDKEIDKLKEYRAGNGAAVVLNPKNGHILAMAGSKIKFSLSQVLCFFPMKKR